MAAAAAAEGSAVEDRDQNDDRWDGPLYGWPDYGVCADSPQAIEHIRTCYAALLTMTDRWLGRVWDTLDAQDAWRDTSSSDRIVITP